MELEMFLMQELFFAKDTRLWVRIEIERDQPGSFDPVAFLRVISFIGKCYNPIAPDYVVYGDTDVIEVGFLRMYLSVTTPDTNFGKS